MYNCFQLNTLDDQGVSEKVDWLFPHRFEEGYSFPSCWMKRDHVPILIQAMVAHHVILPQKMALDQFIQGKCYCLRLME